MSQPGITGARSASKGIAQRPLLALRAPRILRNSCTQPAPSPHYTGAMGSHPLQTLVRHVRRIAGASEPDPIGDADLLARFAASRDESAFAEIVQRHGPLVWAICRTNLNAADADDAFQATFLVLARKAKSIRKPGSLACWLSGVARRTIQAVRARQSRRREITLDAHDLPAPTSQSAEAGDTRQWLAEEIDRLADKYRLPLLLCYYQGLTNEEAARRLGWPHGTVCGRLARARDLLRRDLRAAASRSRWPGLSTVSRRLNRPN